MYDSFWIFAYLCPQNRTYMAEDIKVINYSNIFLSCISKQGCECKFNVQNHSLIYVCSGEVEINDRGQKTIINAGECAFIRRFNGVTIIKRSLGGGVPYRSVTLAFPRKFLMEQYRKMDKSKLPGDARLGRTNLMKIPKRPDLTSLFESITPYYDSAVEPDAKWIEMKLVEGLYAVLRTDKNLYASLFDFTEPWKIDIIDYLNENYMYELSMEDIARYTGRSLATFKRDFKKVSDLTPQKWIIRRRLEKAHELLHAGAERVQDVMMDVGFTNLSYFSRIYKNAYGYPPTAG